MNDAGRSPEEPARSGPEVPAGPAAGGGRATAPTNLPAPAAATGGQAGEVTVAVLGAGVVGAEVVRSLVETSAEYAARVGVPLRLEAVLVRDLDKVRPGVPQELLTTDPTDVGADIVVELLGGIEPARTLLSSALRRGATVITANKALIAAHGPELFALAEAGGGGIYFEAAVAGAVPVVRAVADSLAGDEPQSLGGILNGTTNYILDQMSTTGASYADALAQAQALGYAEADPTADVDGHDAAAKIAILASLAFHTRVSSADVPAEGIRAVTAEDVSAAAAQGRVIKLLARATLGSEGIELGVYPVQVPLTHPLATVHGATNAVVITAAKAGQLVLSGAGAGGAPTSSAVLSDLVVAARQRVRGGVAPRESAHRELPIVAADQQRAQFLLRLRVEDRPGVLAEIAARIAGQQISIATVHQDPAAGAALLNIVTHAATWGDLRQAARDLESLDCVDAVVSVMRVEGE